MKIQIWCHRYLEFCKSIVRVLPPVKKFAKIGGEKVGQPGGQK
jgi:hypothetical protein